MAFGFEFQKPTKEYERKKEILKEASVIVAFREDGDIMPLKLSIENEDERYVYYISKIYYKNLNDAGDIGSIRFGIKLEENSTILTELIYFIQNHQWKIKIAS